MLQVENITKRYSGHTALDNVSLSVPEGSIYGLLGPNGAGKTTLIRIINRITVPDEGRILLSGKEVTQEDVYKIGYLPEERGLYKKMKVGEQAIFFARLKGLSRSEATKRLKVWFEKFGIEEWWNKKVEELSKGMAQKVQFIVTTLHEPKLLILDEPFSGFDPVNANLLRDEILSLRQKGTTVILSTHNMASVEEICDHITLINRSHNILSGKVDEIRRQHGSNIFRVSYRGQEQQLREALQVMGNGCREVELEPRQSHYNTLTLEIERDEDISRVVEIINRSVELRTFEELIPSMNDIFIKAVGGNL